MAHTRATAVEDLSAREMHALNRRSTMRRKGTIMGQAITAAFDYDTVPETVAFDARDVAERFRAFEA